jgi:hypothetical protein
MDQADQEGRPLTAQEIRQTRRLREKVTRARLEKEAEIALLEYRGTPNSAADTELSMLKAQHAQLVLTEERLAQVIRTGHAVPEAQQAADAAGNPAQQLIGLPGLGVCVFDSKVYVLSKGGQPGDFLGPLAGARAEAIPGTVGHRRTGGQRAADATLAAVALHSPIGLLAGAYSRPRNGGIAVVVFPTGNAWQTTLPDSASVARALAEAMRFNALADAATQPETPGHDDTGIAAQLERLAALHANGALNDDEYQAAKARIISG